MSGMPSARNLALAVALAALVTLPFWMPGIYYINVSSQVLFYAIFALVLWLMLERTRLGAMIRASVDDPQMARVVGIRVSRLFTLVFSLGAGLAGFAGVIGAPILSVYPGLDFEMLPLALVVVILGGAGSLLGSFLGSFIIGVLYNYGQALYPELAYFVLFLPMVIVLLVRPQGLFGRISS
jgi:branched-chain amino acid transport system permease protein